MVRHAPSGASRGTDQRPARSAGTALRAAVAASLIVLVAPLAIVTGTTAGANPNADAVHATASSGGYWEVANDGGIFAFGAPFEGSTGGTHLNAPIVGMAVDPATGGYWEVANDGGIFAFGAPFEGSTGGTHLNAPIVGMAVDPATGGYWEVANDGGIFAFGAPFEGSTGGTHLNAPIVGMAVDPATGGYWEVASDGGIFAFGAPFEGSMGGTHLNKPIVGIAAMPTGKGYWEVASDGGIFAFGAAQFFGSMGGTHLNAPIVGMTATATGGGYWEVASDGGEFNFGDAPFEGSMGGTHLNAPIVGMAATSELPAGPVTLVQSAPTGASVAHGAGYSGHLAVTNGSGAVDYSESQSAGSDEVVVSHSGGISASPTLPPGSYAISGTDHDSSGDSGTWTFTLTVGTVAILQTSATSDAVSTTKASSYSSQLTVADGTGPVHYQTSTTTPALTVSASGLVRTSGPLRTGTYAVSGTDGDGFGDSGTWNFTLHVTAVTITQTSPSSGSTSTTTSAGFTAQMATTGGNGPVTYSEETSTDSVDVRVSSSGAITTEGTLAAGTYAVTGTTADGDGDAGAWTYTLTVAAESIAQTAPTTGSATTTTSATFGAQLSTTGGNGTVTYAESTSADSGDVTVSSSGAVTTSGTLAAGTYTVSGTVSDGFGDAGTWNYSLAVAAVVLTQTGSASGSVTTAGSAGFTAQLTTTGGPGTQFAETASPDSGDVRVSSTGAVTTSGTLHAGTYAVSGTTDDGAGDSGAWTYTLTVGAVPIVQAAPTSGTVTTSASAAFADQLSSTGGQDAVTYVETTSADSGDLTVSSSGAVATVGTLAAGSYTVSGATADGFGDTGTWTYTLSVTAVTLTQASPTSGSATTTTSGTFSAQLTVTANSGPVTYVETGGATTDVRVSSAGAVSTAGDLAAATYSVSGTTTDGYGDTGTWSYTLTVTPVTLTQGPPTSGSTSTTASGAFSAQLTVDGNPPSLTYAESTSTDSADVAVSRSGAVTTTSPLGAGDYTVTGTVTDDAGDTGAWTYTLVVDGVTLVQTTPVQSEVTTAASGAFSAQLAVSGSPGTVTFAESTSADSGVLLVSGTGALTTDGTLHAGSYHVSGSTSDGYGDSGTWTYSLTVNAVAIAQATPSTGSVATTTSADFASQLATSGNVGPVSFAQSTTADSGDVVVSASGAVSTSGPLAAGTYSVSGTTSDGYGDSGTWTYSLTVDAVAIAQATPSTGSVATTTSAAFTAKLATTGNLGPATYSETTSADSGDVVVSASGAVSTSGPLAAGTYSVSGTTADAFDDTGTWTYTLHVTPVTIAQSTPTSGTTTTAGSPTFRDQLRVNGNDGLVTYAESTTADSGDVVVSASGAVSTSGTLAAGTYTVSGSTADPAGDAGAWTYTLTVSPVTIAQTTPSTGSVTTTTSAAFTAQLATAGNTGPATFVEETSTDSGSVIVSSGGAVTTDGLLSAGSYRVSGTTSDADGNSGTWAYTLHVGAVALTQTAPLNDTVSTATSGTFTNQLGVSGNSGPVTFTESISSDSTSVIVSPTGAVTTSGPLGTGTFAVSGTVTDTHGDEGTWAYKLHVTRATIVQTTTGAASTDVTTSSTFAAQLTDSGNIGSVTFTTTTPTASANLRVSPSGSVTTSGTLSAGTYTASGTTADGFGDAGTWSYTLSVSAVPIDQATPTAGTVTTSTSATFTAQLATTGSPGGVVFTTTSATPSGDVVVSTGGAVTTSGTLATGSYTVSGTTADGYGDTGTWSYALSVTAVTIRQTAPTSATVTSATSAAFSTQLATTGNLGPATYAESTSADSGNVIVSSTGNVSTAGTLPVGTYNVSGASSDVDHDTGTWAFVLHVTPVAIDQATPTSGTVTTTTSATFAAQLSATGNLGPVTYIETASANSGDVVISSTGAVTTGGLLPAGTYAVSGTTQDPEGNTGVWTYTLHVTPVAIAQSTPTSGTTTTTTAATFTAQLATTGNLGPDAYSETTSADSGDVVVSASGAVSASGPLAAGTYTVSGTTADAFDDTGTWTYTLHVTPVAIDQAAPTSGTTTTTTSATFAAHLATTGNVGPAAYVETVSTDSTDVLVSASGAVSTSGTLAAGTYTVSGTTADAFGDAGSWTYALHVSAVALTQGAPAAATVTTTTSGTFTDQLAVDGGEGPTTFAQTVGPTPHILVATTGTVSVDGPLVAGIYTASGTASDGFGDAGTWSFTLSVTAVTLSQLPPTVGTITSTTSAGYAAQLTVAGNIGPVTFAESTSADASKVLVSGSGSVSTSGSLHVGTYNISGTSSDAFGDTGTWVYTLHVIAAPIIQTTPLSGSISTTTSAAFTTQLAVSGNNGPVTYVESSSTDASDLTVSPTGAVTTSGTLSAGTYAVSGTTADPDGDGGTWAYTLHVTRATIVQTTAGAASTDVTTSSTFAAQLTDSGNIGSVTFTTTTPTASANLRVSPSGSVTTSGTLSAGTYTASGTTADGFGDAGTWSYTLSVSAVPIDQATPTAGTVTTSTSATFTAQLATTGNSGAVTYSETTSADSSEVLVSAGGSVTTSDPLATGTYTVSGTTADGYGDTGTWSYALDVTAVAIDQGAPTSGTVTTTTATHFTAPLSTTGGTGPVTFTETASADSPAVHVSATGVVSVPDPLAAGTYTVSGTTADGFGDTGTWSYALHITAVAIDQATPAAGTVTTTTSATFTAQLATTGSPGGVVFTTTSATPSGDVVVSTGGAVTTSGTLATGSYTVSGTTADGYGDTGTWSYTLSVTAVTIRQSSPTSVSVTTTTSGSYTDEIAVSGSPGSVTFATTAPTGSGDLIVSPTGSVTTEGTLHTGSYVASGTTSDGYGDMGTWAFVLHVTPVAIDQATPTSGTVTTTTSATFAAQLSATGNLGPVTYIETASANSGDVVISSTGAVTTGGLLPAGTYAVSGTTQDPEGNTGVWTYTLHVTPVAIAQSTPTSGTTTTTTAATFTAQLATTGNLGPDAYSETTSADSGDVVVSASGAVSASGPLAAGTYTVSGTTADAFDDTGTWTYTLHVTPVAIDQAAPTSGTTTTTTSATFAAHLATTGNVGPAAYVETVSTDSTDVLVSASGAVSTSGTLAAGTYTVSGTTADAFGDTGTWTYALHVAPVTIAQSIPTSGTTTTTTSATFTAQLATNGNLGPAAYEETTSADSPDINISRSGKVTTTATLPVGAYTVSGTTADAFNDAGTWSYTLHVGAVTIDQTSPISGTVTTAASAHLTAELATTGNAGPAAYAETVSTDSTDVLVSTTGNVTTSGSLHSGTYTVAGTTTDGFGDTGTWSYTLHVTAVAIDQATPTSGTVSTATSAHFTAPLATTGATGAVTYATTTPTAALTVSGSGGVTTQGTLHAGTYAVSGTTADGFGDTGTWSYTLHVLPGAIQQSTPTSGTVTTATSAHFTASLATTGNLGSTNFAENTSADSGSVHVSATGTVTTSGSLHSGTYTVSGTTADGYGDTGTWSYTLDVTAVTIDQAAPTSGTVTTATSAHFTASLATTGATGAVSYATTTPTGAVAVSDSGAFATAGTLHAGAYTVSGTTADGFGDTGTWSYTLHVTAVTIHQAAPTSGTVTTATSAHFTASLATAGATGSVSYATTTPTGAVAVSSAGGVTSAGTLHTGAYTVSGTTADGFGDTGTWSYTLHVTAVTIHQAAPTSGTVTTATSAHFTASLAATGAVGSVAYATTTAAAGVTVSSIGGVTTTGTLHTGTYTVSGTTSDPYGDTGTWSYALHVTAVTIHQATPTSGTATTTTSAHFTASLTTTGAVGTVTYAETTSADSGDVPVSSTGGVTTDGTLHTGTYTVSGTTSDVEGDAGTWTYTLHVTGITVHQTTPTSASIGFATSAGFNTTLATTGGIGAVTFATTSATPSHDLTVSTGGAVTTSGSLRSGTYTASGTTSDPYGDTGTWTFTLSVVGVPILQAAPTTGTVTTATSAGFGAKLATTGNQAPVTFSETTSADSSDVVVAATGAVTTSGTLHSGTYTVTGTTGDDEGDAGTWSYALTVTAVTVLQGLPKFDNTIGPTSATFTAQLVTTGNSGAATFAVTAGTTGSLTVSSSGLVSTTGTLKTRSTYFIYGTDTDAFGDSGTWFFYLTVYAVPTLTSVTPNAGPTAGGGIVTLKGTGFAPDANTVHFGTVTIRPTTTTSTPTTHTVLTITAPAHAAGPVTVTLSTPGGTTSGITYTYATAPSITSFTPTSGSSGGNTTVTITGTDLTGATSVKFGTTTAASFTVTGATTIKAVTKSHPTGTVKISVATPGGSVTSAATYHF